MKLNAANLKNVLFYEAELIHNKSIGQSKLIHTFDVIVHMHWTFLPDEKRVNNLVKS